MVNEGNPHFSTEDLAKWRSVLSERKLEPGWGSLGEWIGWQPLAWQDSRFFVTEEVSGLPTILEMVYAGIGEREPDSLVDDCVFFLRSSGVRVNLTKPPLGCGGTSYDTENGTVEMWLGSDFSSLDPTWKLFKLQHMNKSLMLRMSVQGRNGKGLLELLRTDYDFVFLLWKNTPISEYEAKKMLVQINSRIDELLMVP